MSQRELERRIKRLIKTYYGWNLGSFRDEMNYSEGLQPFVHSLVQVIKGERPAIDSGAPYATVATGDVEIMRRLKQIRLNRGASIETVATKMRVHPRFLKALEDGQIVSFPHQIRSILQALASSPEERLYIWEAIDSFSKQVALGVDSKVCEPSDMLPAETIKWVIERYYGHNLWIFRPEHNYEASLAPFVESLVRLVRVNRADKKARMMIRRLRAKAPDKRVHWTVLLAQQDEGIADIS